MYRFRSISDNEKIKYRFFKSSSEYSKFNNISLERIEEIKKDIESFKKENINKKFDYLGNSRNGEYIEVLCYLSSFKCSNYTYDEKIVFIILMFDPELKFYNIYSNFNIVDLETIKSVETDMEKKELNELRKKQIFNLECEVRRAIGIWDVNLIAYERDYLARVLNNNCFVKNAPNDYSSSLFKKICELDDLIIGKERFEYVNEKVKEYISSIDRVNYIDLAFHILFQNDILKLRNNKEQLLFFVLAFDPELKVLNIYEDEPTVKKIKERLIMEFGFYNKELIKVERLYHSHYCPDYQYSEWVNVLNKK